MRHIVNALFLRDGAVLLVRRAPHRKAYPGLWSFPGGHVEPGETLEQALVREAIEEVGVTPTAWSLAGRIADPDAPPTEPITYHLHAVTAWSGGEPRMVGDEHTELRWFRFEAAAALADLALEEYRPLIAASGNAVEGRSRRVP